MVNADKSPMDSHQWTPRVPQEMWATGGVIAQFTVLVSYGFASRLPLAWISAALAGFGLAFFGVRWLNSTVKKPSKWTSLVRIVGVAVSFLSLATPVWPGFIVVPLGISGLWLGLMTTKKNREYRLNRDLLDLWIQKTSIGVVVEIAVIVTATRWLPAAGLILMGVMAIVVAWASFGHDEAFGSVHVEWGFGQSFGIFVVTAVWALSLGLMIRDHLALDNIALKVVLNGGTTVFLLLLMEWGMAYFTRDLDTDKITRIALVTLSAALVLWLSARAGQGVAIPILLGLTMTLISFGWIRLMILGEAMAPVFLVTALSVGWAIPLLAHGTPHGYLVGALLVLVSSGVLWHPRWGLHPRAGQGRDPNTADAPSKIMPDPENYFKDKQLTQQERRIVGLLLQGLNNQRIVAELYISINTLKTHLRNIYRKTETHNRHELVEAIRQLDM